VSMGLVFMVRASGGRGAKPKTIADAGRAAKTGLARLAQRPPPGGNPPAPMGASPIGGAHPRIRICFT
jgi:hypothetical protein